MVVVVVDNIHGYSIIIINIHKLHEYPLLYAPLISIAIDPHKKHQLPFGEICSRIEQQIEATARSIQRLVLELPFEERTICEKFGEMMITLW